MALVEELPTNWRENTPRLAAELTERGRRLALDGHPREALTLLAKALTLEPRNVVALINAGGAAGDCKMYEESKKFTDDALKLDPTDAESAICWNNLGIGAYRERDYDHALQCFSTAMRLDRFYKIPVISKGATYVLLDRLSEAYELFERANLMHPEDWQPIVNRGILHLLRGDWDLGLPGYEKRELYGEAANIKWPVPRWDGEPLNGRSVLIWPDQGIGDSIWAHRLVAEVVKQGKVYLQVYQNLEEIMPVPAGVKFVRAGDGIDDLHFHVPVMSLPYCLRIRHNTAPPPYGLTVKRQSRQDGPLRVGLTWCGNINHKLDDLRSVELSQAIRVRDAMPAGALLFNLQYQARPHETDAVVAAGFANEPIASFKELAELIASLDLVITVDTANLHVAAEMGVPTWGLIPFAPDFRWGQKSSTVPWYPSLRMYRNRQPKDGWGEVIDRICADLKELA